MSRAKAAYLEAARSIAGRLPGESSCVVIGSTTFWSEDGEPTCEFLGRELARIQGLTLVTGGMAGVGEVVGRSFWNARQPGGDEPHVFHVLPEEFGAWDYGATLFAGDTLEERREVLARVSSIYVVIEGGPGTRQEARIARKNGAVLIPVARTGGCARRLHARLRCPVPGLEREWTELRAPGPTPADLARAVSAIVARLA